MGYRQCSICDAPLGDCQELFTWGGDAMYLCEECSDKIKDFIDGLVEESAGSMAEEMTDDDNGE